MFFCTTMVENYIINFPHEVFLTIPHTERKKLDMPCHESKRCPVILFIGIYVCLSALRCAARCTYKATFLIYQRFIAAFWTLLPFCLRTVWQVFFQCSLNAHFPCIDRLVVEFKTTYQLNHLIYRHTISQNA